MMLVVILLRSSTRLLFCKLYTVLVGESNRWGPDSAISNVCQAMSASQVALIQPIVRPIRRSSPKRGHGTLWCIKIATKWGPSMQ